METLTVIWTALFILGVVELVRGADQLVEGGGKTAAYLGVPAIIIGLTLVSFGTSLPELAASLNAVLKQKQGLSLGNVVGSNIANILLVLGISSLINPISVDRGVIKREIPIMFGAIALLTLFASGSVIQRWEGTVLLVGFIAYVGFFAWMAIRDNEKDVIKEEIKDEDYVQKEGYDVRLCVTQIVVGLLAIAVGAELMIRGAVYYMDLFGLSEGIVGLTIIALATTLPELAASGMASYKGESDISLGNVIGSNTFNILMVVGICAAVVPITFSAHLFSNLMILIAVSIILTVFMYTGKELSRKEGALMLVGYIAYIAYLFLF